LVSAREAGTAWEWLFLAMAHAKGGQGKEAKACLARAARWRELPRPEGGGAADAEAFWDRVELEQLRREAESMLRPKK
jgi:hypothetical protein